MRTARWAAVVAMVGTWLMPASVAGAAPPDPSKLPVAVGDASVFDQVDGMQRNRLGSWSLVDRPVSTRSSVSFGLKIQPPATGMPGRSGPAILFVRLSLFGGTGGDIGFETPVRTATVVVPACSDAACTYAPRLTLSTTPLARLLERYPSLENPMLLLSLTLVRTFGQGTWLQIVPLQPDQCSVCGVLQSGEIQSFGVFPAERAKAQRVDAPLDYVAAVRDALRTAVDPSDAVPTVDALFDAKVHGCTDNWTIAIHDEDGNLPLLVPPSQPARSRIMERIRLPDRRTWTLTSEGSSGLFDFGFGHAGPGMHVGSFTTAGRDLRIVADLSCLPTGPTGTMHVTYTTLPDTAMTSIPSPGPAIGLLALVAAVVASLITWLAWRRRTALARV